MEIHGVGWRRVVAAGAGVLLALAACARSPGVEARDSAAAAQPLLSDARQLTFSGRRAGEGYFGADGRRLVFQSERDPENPFYQIFLMDLETGDVRRVSPGLGKTTCAWLHPDGNRVLFASTHHDPASAALQAAELAERAAGRERRYAWDFDPEYELYEADLGTGEFRRLSFAAGYDAEASFSPDGEWIVFASNRHAFAEASEPAAREALARDPASAMELYRMRADGSDVRRLTHAPGYDGGPFFGPRGERIVWRRFSEDGATAEIWSMRADGSEPRMLTRLGAMSWAPFFHPSGEYVIFATNLHGFDNFELYLVDADGAREPVRVTEAPGFDGLPAFAPDGRSLAWTTTRTPDGSAQVFLGAWDHGEALRRLGLAGETPEAAATTFPGAPGDLRSDDVRRHVEHLTAAPMDGRATGTEGERLATAYVAETFEALGLEPAGTEGWYEPFEFTAGVSLGDANALRLEGPEGARRLQPGADWTPLGFSRTGEAPAGEIAFAGYGIVAPAGAHGPAYDAYAGLDVSDRWVLVFRFLPEDVPAERRQELSRYASLRHKAMLARDRGARGLVVVSGPRSQVKQPLVPLGTDVSLAGTSLFALSVSDAVADALLAPAGRELEALQAALDAGEPVAGFVLPQLSLSARVDVRKVRRTGRNVLGRLRAPGASEEPYVMLGAHVDHLGHGGGGTSLAPDSDAVHPGADDNASGVAVLLEIAASLAARQRREPGALGRDVVFAAWSGEELGLLGSNHHAAGLGTPDPHAIDPARAVVAYLNFDMVGRLQRELVIQGVGSSRAWPALIEARNAPVGLSIVTQADSYLPTDATSFYLAGVPVLSFFTGAHADYHKPSDTAEKLDYAGAARIARLAEGIATALANREALPAYEALARPSGEGDRAALRAYLGTIPDYAAEDVVGVRLSGVVADGPAARAGLGAGDVIVELAGTRIENIYDYTYAIQALKIGEPATAIVLRDGQRLRLEITPESRQ